MGMFDYYQPKGDRLCPICHHPLVEWQGKDGPRQMYTWEEGKAAPPPGAYDPATMLALLKGESVEHTFEIYSYDCPVHRPVLGICRAVKGLWVETELRYEGGHR